MEARFRNIIKNNDKEIVTFYLSIPNIFFWISSLYLAVQTFFLRTVRNKLTIVRKEYRIVKKIAITLFIIYCVSETSFHEYSRIKVTLID